MSESAPPSSSTPTYPAGNVAALLDRYQILGIIGQGGMGTVYKGFHLSLKRFVAIKVLRLDKNNSPELVSRFLREMQAIGQMDHPNVVRATDGGEKNGLFFLVMEYLEGADLSRLVVRRGRLETANACELVRQAAVGLDYVHQTLVHRDVKPSNLILTPAGLVKILDLGLARLHEIDMADWERTPEGCALGTYDYMAPEQASGSGRVDGRTDEYSLGCTLFKLLTGHAPFAGPQYDNVARKLYAHGHVPLTAVAEFPLIPEELRPVLLRMTAKDPAERYPTAGDVARALAPFAAGSQPLQLLGRADDLADTVLQPLPVPLPAELSRLTAAGTATLPNSSPIGGNPQPVAPLHRDRRVLVGVAVGICALAAVLFCGPALLTRLGEALPTQPSQASGATGPGPGLPGKLLRPLDELKPQVHFPLLDRAPLPVGSDGEDVRKWRWDQGQQQLEVHGPDLVFLLGTTSRSSFTFEAAIAQIPWTGGLGMVWGYRENAEAKTTKTADQEFAWFQVICIWHSIGDKGENHYFVRRGKASLCYDASGEMKIAPHWTVQQEVRSPDGQKILVIDVERNRLGHAWLGSVELTDLSSDAAHKALASEPYQGALGLIAFSHQGTFSKVRFIAQSND